MTAVEAMRVLVVDDSPSDSRLIQLWLRQSPLIQQVDLARDGESALEFLSQKMDGGLPHLILLDLNLPRCSGFDVLASLRQDPRLAHVPVVILTGSTCPKDAQQALALQAARCLTKPADADEFGDLVRVVESFWEREEQGFLPGPLDPSDRTSR